MNDKPKAYAPGDHERERLQKELDKQKLVKDTFDDLTNNPKYKEFFDLYHPGSIESFIKAYSTYKGMWMTSGPMFMKLEEERAVQFRKEAEGYLWIINQKKMFNQQCLWRAGKIKLEGVESIYDFWRWEKDTKRCPFLEPITREEFELVKKADASSNLNDAGPLFDENNLFAGMMFHWQGYDEFKKYYNENGGANPFPDWYNYYDMHFGTGDLFHLEDVKFEKEDRYCLIGHDFQFPDQKVLEKHPDIMVPKKAVVQKPIPVEVSKVPVDNRPYLQTDDHQILRFMNQFEEDKQIKEYGNLCVDALEDKMGADIDTNDLVEFLLKVNEPLPIKASWNWLEGLQELKNEYRGKKQLEVLDDVYSEYLLRISNDIPLDFDEQYEHMANSAKGLGDAFKEKVLLGRKILGEPQDFNF
jgi:hypothetical protein